jgi:hypothetical protein
MGDNIIILCGDEIASYLASEIAIKAGDDLGLVLTAIDFEDEKVSGGRIEEDRSYGKGTFQTFDEPIFIGSAIAQLAGHADSVIVDSLDDWAHRLLLRFPDSPTELDAEVASLSSVMKAQMSDLILLARKPEALPADQAEAKALTASLLEQVNNSAAIVIDASGESPKAVKGEMP